jgi:2'-hydroxyisoflavone reductase
MQTTRRGFLKTSVATGAMMAMAGGLSPALASIARARPSAAKKVLILGGTAFIGPALIDACKARGHSVTIFNRGRTEKRLGTHVAEDVERLYGNRDPEKRADDADPQSPKGLSQLEGREWDAVVDNSGYFPRVVKASAELLAPKVKQYIFISSLSAYAENKTAGEDESAPLATMEDPSVENMGKDFSNYGPLKVLCEKAAEAALPGRVANVRPGFIVGPGDPTDRWTYWPVRIKRGGEVLVPGTPADPVMIIDVRDLAEWLVVLIENNTNGEFNACGPKDPMTMAQMVEACKKGVGADASFTWVNEDFLEKVPEQVQFPIWVSPKEAPGFHTRKNAKAVAAGLKFRPVEDTAKATLEWFNALPDERKKKMLTMVESNTEAAVLKRWHEKS